MGKAAKSIRTPDKQRILDCICHRERPDIPMLERDPDMSLAEKILEKSLPYNIHTYELEPEDNIELNLRMGNDLVDFNHLWRVGRKEKADKEGRLHYIDGTIKRRSDFDQIWYPDLGELERKLEMTCKMVEGTGLGVLCGAQSAISTAFTAMGPNDFLLNTLMDTDLVKDLIEILHKYCIKEMQLLLSYPIDMMRISSRLNTQNGPLISKNMIETLETPCLKEQIKIIKDYNIPVYFHMDGKVDDLIPSFIEMGIDVLNPIEPSGGQDIFEIKKRYGQDITLCGNIDINSVLKDGTPEEVRENIINHLQILGKGGGYIVASSHDLHQLIPINNFYAMRDTVAEFRLK